MRRSDAVRKAGRDRIVRLGQVFVEQEPGSDVAAGFLVIGELQLDRAVELGALLLGGHQCQGGVGVGGEVRLGHRHAAAIHHRAMLAPGNLAAVRVARPAKARRHHIAMRVHCDGRSTAAKALAHHEVGGADHARGLDLVVRHLVRLDRKSELLEQLARALAMGIAVAGRVVRRHLHQFGQKGLLLRTMLINKLRERRFDGIHVVACGHDLARMGRTGSLRSHCAGWKCSTNAVNTSAATWASSAVMVSVG